MKNDLKGFDFKINRRGEVQFDCEEVRLRVSLDSAYELQYELAEFLAHLELKQYPEAPCHRNLYNNEDSRIADSRHTLESLTSIGRFKNTFAI